MPTSENILSLIQFPYIEDIESCRTSCHVGGRLLKRISWSVITPILLWLMYLGEFAAFVTVATTLVLFLSFRWTLAVSLVEKQGQQLTVLCSLLCSACAFTRMYSCVKYLSTTIVPYCTPWSLTPRVLTNVVIPSLQCNNFIILLSNTSDLCNKWRWHLSTQPIKIVPQVSWHDKKPIVSLGQFVYKCCIPATKCILMCLSISVGNSLRFDAL